MITSINEFRKYNENRINEDYNALYPFTSQSKTVRQAMEQWWAGNYDESEIEAVLRQENDIYTFISMNIFIEDDYMDKNEVFCMAMNKILNITNTGQFMKETIPTIKSKYHSEKINIALYLLLQKYTDGSFDTALNAIDKLANVDKLNVINYNPN